MKYIDENGKPTNKRQRVTHTKWKTTTTTHRLNEPTPLDKAQKKIKELEKTIKEMQQTIDFLNTKGDIHLNLHR